MLLEFRVRNHRSIREEQAISLTPGRIEHSGSVGVVTAEDGVRVLPVLALYGANASGKTNVLDAIGLMRHAVMFSARTWEPDAGIALRDPFAWGAARAEPTVLEISFLTNGVRYEYGFAADDDCFLEEWLYAYPHGRKQMWLEREGSEFRFGEFLRGENKAVAKLTRPNALFLSTAVQLRHEGLQPIYSWFSSKLRTININSRTSRIAFSLSVGSMLERMLDRESVPPTAVQETLEGFESPPRLGLEELMGMLRAADVGIEELRVVSDDLSSDSLDGTRRSSGRGKRIVVRHKSSAPDAWLSLERESHGTRTLIAMSPAIIHTLNSGGVLVVDELEASLHPLLALRVVLMFNDPTLNRSGAQLVFATHDTNLLGNTLGDPVLLRDQIWFAEKNDEGCTEIYPLTDFNPRKAENMERGYLQGRYGAIPFLGGLRWSGTPS